LAGCLLSYLLFLPRRASVQASHHEQKVPVATLLRSRPFVLLALSFTLQSIVIAGMAAHVIALLSASGVGTAIGLVAAASIGVMQVFGRIMLLFAGSRLNPAMTAKLVVWLLPAAILTMLAVGISPWLAFLYAFLFGSCNGMMTIVKGTAAADLISRERVAMLNGVIALPTSIARAGGPILIAAVWDFYGNPQAALLVLLGVASCAAFSLAAAYRAAANTNSP
jgi:MFS family permease